ncbi:LAGLIDADG family homing endonuclease [Kitasatospora sp. McL0602]|uniref:LAGLIDADG family homing endonuclease n=1 Tax=Kitasatospora sp. McL0602 TaxID=3439530 RepID=UPI003F8A9B34
MNSFSLENPEHAYMFGFIQADGHLRQGPGNKGSLAVELSARDAPLLEEFQRLCPYNSSIRYRTRTTNFATEHTSVTWTVCAREFRETLCTLGLPTGRKSTIVAPPVVPHSSRDYLRGLIDADGSLGLTAESLPFVGFTTASEALASYFCRYADQLTGSPRTLRRNRRDNIFNIVFTREEAVTLARDLYTPGRLALTRKREAAERLASWVRPPDMQKVRRRTWTTEEDEALLAATDLTAAASQLDRSLSSYQTRHWRLVGPKKARARTPRTLA